MDKKKKQQNTKRIPPIQQISNYKIRHNSNGRFKYSRKCLKIKNGHQNYKK